MAYARREDRIARDAAYYAINSERVKERERNRYATNREAIRARRLEIITPELRAKHAERERLRYAELRGEMLEAYGSSCSCCGEKQPLFLELDHIQNDGAEHRKLIGRGAKMIYTSAKKAGWPRDRFQLLCANCNQGKNRNGGRCPHHG